MTNYKKIAINIAVLTFLLTGGISFAYSSHSSSKDDFQENDLANIEIVLLESFENEDYETWRKYIGKNSNTAKFISKEKFDKFVKIRSLARDGRYDKALSLSDKFETEIKTTLEKIINNENDRTVVKNAINTIEKIKIVKKAAEKNII